MMDAIQLWTHHPSSIRLDTPALQIDPELGQYWNHRQKNFRYREVARKFWKSLGTNQFLWCCTIRGMFVRPTEELDLVEWEIKAPPAKIIAFIRSNVWEDLVWSRSDVWDGLFINEPPTQGHENINALVSVPLPPGSVVCNGQVRPQYTRAQMEQAAEILRNLPHVDPKLIEEYDIDSLD